MLRMVSHGKRCVPVQSSCTKDASSSTNSKKSSHDGILQAGAQATEWARRRQREDQFSAHISSRARLSRELSNRNDNHSLSLSRFASPAHLPIRSLSHSSQHRSRVVVTLYPLICVTRRTLSQFSSIKPSRRFTLARPNAASYAPVRPSPRVGLLSVPCHGNPRRVHPPPSTYTAERMPLGFPHAVCLG
ncbi:hypothetical protein BDQ12DRAFT_265362 [Crucibulum laeve]|uniref:Uncharacterized protein n=1 Tax=Crucibulum laeve TaxID=68775 RepID=A0A5C3LUQ5_9AGAR|nr:hypothetical protein BDQ12DRAFT_265362 [Crucibulum laeve]